MKKYSDIFRQIGRCASVFALATLFGCLTHVQEASSTDRLIGAWKIVQRVTSNSSGEAVDNDPPPGMYIFTDSHMTNLIVREWEPRPAITRDSSDADKLAAYSNFIADGGEYWIEGNVIQTHNFVAKNPMWMRPDRPRGDGIRYRFYFDGDDLVLTMTGQGWARDGSLTYRLQRME